MEQPQYNQREIDIHFLSARTYLNACERAIKQTPGMRAESLLAVLRQEIVKDELFALARQFRVPAQCNDNTITSRRDKVFMFALMVVTIVAIGWAVIS